MLRVYGLGIALQVPGKVQGLGIRAEGLGFWDQSYGFQCQGFTF